jgi:hypothetical protein
VAVAVFVMFRPQMGLYADPTKRTPISVLKRGVKFIRVVLLVVVLAFVARLGYDQFHG